MSSLIRWNPLREMSTLRNEMDRLFNEMWDVTPWRENLSLELDVAENDDSYIVKASVPGMTPDDLNITLTNDVLTIAGEHKEEKDIDENNYRIRERRFGSFSRSIRLPMAVKQDAIEANYEHGVLTLTLPKAEESKPKRIAIKGDNGKTVVGKIAEKVTGNKK